MNRTANDLAEAIVEVGVGSLKERIEAELIRFGQAVRDEDVHAILRYRLDCKKYSSADSALAAAQAAAAEKLIAEISMLKVE